MLSIRAICTLNFAWETVTGKRTRPQVIAEAQTADFSFASRTAYERYLEWAATGTNVPNVPTATATDGDQQNWPINPTHTSRGNGSSTSYPAASVEYDETITSTTTIQATITISLTSQTTTYPISCTYDEYSKEICWSQMPPKTATTVTVTQYVTTTLPPKTVSITKHVTKTMTRTRTVGNGTYMASTDRIRRRPRTVHLH